MQRAVLNTKSKLVRCSNSGQGKVNDFLVSLGILSSSFWFLRLLHFLSSSVLLYDLDLSRFWQGSSSSLLSFGVKISTSSKRSFLMRVLEWFFQSNGAEIRSLYPNNGGSLYRVLEVRGFILLFHELANIGGIIPLASRIFPRFGGPPNWCGPPNEKIRFCL